MSILQILHISDLHITSKDFFDRRIVLEPLLARIREDRKNGLRPELVAVTGDIAYAGLADQYEPARLFFSDLLDALKLPPERLFLVPGNHDVYRKKFPKSSGMPVYQSMKELNKELENEEYRAHLLSGMDSYFSFVETHYPHLKSAHGRLVPFVHSYPAACGKRIGLVGLNSAWMCRKSPDEKQIAIGEFQVRMALDELHTRGEHDLMLVLFHHPLTWLWPADRTICRTLLNEVVVLSGHLHEEAGGYVHDLEGRIHQFLAGAAYDGSQWPSGFQYLTFDWVSGVIQLDYRKFVPEKRIWCVAAEKGKDGKGRFSLSGAGTVTDDDSLEGVVISRKDDAFAGYCEAALQEHRHLPTQGFETTLRVPIELERVYINMHAQLHYQDFDELTLAGKKQMRKKMEAESIPALDIKAAFAEAERCKVKDLVILGEPGCGKTTLLKYLLVMLIEGKGREKLGLGPGLIPFFAPLRDLRDPGTEGLTDFLMRVCGLAEQGLTPESLQEVLQRGRALVLLDGLDEVANEEKRIKVCKWLDTVRRQQPRTRFVVTSRYGGYLGKSRLAGNHLELSIRDFTPEEAREFLVRWFEAVKVALHGNGDADYWSKKGRDAALALAERITASEHLQRLAVNPLLLQIIALVHRDRGTLPQRRVELYEECTNVLLEKWDMAKGLDVLLTARQARKISTCAGSFCCCMKGKKCDVSRPP